MIPAIGYDKDVGTLLLAGLILGVVNFVVRPCDHLSHAARRDPLAGAVPAGDQRADAVADEQLVDGFAVGGFWSTIGGALIVWIVNAALRRAQRSAVARLPTAGSAVTRVAAARQARARAVARRRLVAGRTALGPRGLRPARRAAAGRRADPADHRARARCALRRARGCRVAARMVALATFVVVFARVAHARGWPARWRAAGWPSWPSRWRSARRRRGGRRRSRSPSAPSRWRRCCCRGSGRRGRADRCAARVDLPARATATALLVLGLTGAAAGLGPTLTGVLTPFPGIEHRARRVPARARGPGAAGRLLSRLLARRLRLLCVLLSRRRAGRSARRAAAFVLALCGALAAQLVVRAIAGASRALPSRAPAARLAWRRYGFSASASMISPHVSTANASNSEMPSSNWPRALQKAALRRRHVRSDQPLGQHAHRDVFRHRSVEAPRAFRQRVKPLAVQARTSAQTSGAPAGLLAQLTRVGAHGVGQLGVAPVQRRDGCARTAATAPALWPGGGQAHLADELERQRFGVGVLRRARRRRSGIRCARPRSSDCRIASARADLGVRRGHQRVVGAHVGRGRRDVARRRERRRPGASADRAAARDEHED